MNQNKDQGIGVVEKIKAFKSAFSNSNMVRMREAFRYLSKPKLALFINIPFYIHVNLPQFPGYIKNAPPCHGILNFRESGFYKAGIDLGLPPDESEDTTGTDGPSVLGLYHMGSLGTFTQSDNSDFDYWVIIDKYTFSEQRHYNFQKKLDQIVQFARSKHGQEVSFFIMDQSEIRKDCYTGLDEQETLEAPKLFLKEEFYRTFLYIAGKIPLWTILPPKGSDDPYEAMVKKRCADKTPNPVNKDFIDLGNVENPKKPDILRGILWHIYKSRFDPAKALIKATMVFSHEYGSPEHSELLCDQIKARYSEAGIDDYRVDPYKTLFDRVIAFHDIRAKDSLNLIKNAIFLRLCGYPNVSPPDPGSPKKQLLDRYIRNWNLKPAQVKKLFSHENWAEEEKLLLEKTFINRLLKMYAQISRDMDIKALQLDKTDQRNLKILTHKVKERLNQTMGKIQVCSTFLKGQPFQSFLFGQTSSKVWKLYASRHDASEKILLRKSDTFLSLMGWVLENNLYHMSDGTMKLITETNLFQGADHPVGPDSIYLALQPVKPLSDNAWEYDPQWKKLVILLKCAHPSSRVSGVEFLALNTWGELFSAQLKLDTKVNMDDRYRQIALEINQYKGENLRLIFFQLGDRKDKDAVSKIKSFLESRFLTQNPKKGSAKRPLLDKL